MTLAEEFRFRREVDVRYRDIDSRGHAHHTTPLIYFEEARAAYWREVAGRDDLEGIDYLLAEATIRYHRPVRYPERLTVGVRTTRLGRKSFTMEYEARSAAGELLASGTTVQVMYDYAAGCSKAIPPELRHLIEAFEKSGGGGGGG